MRPKDVCTSILLTVLSCGHVTAKEPCVSYEVERKPGKALVGHVNTTLVLNQPDCMSACNKLLHCYSVNLYRGTNGDSMCEISTSNREMSPGCFVSKPEYEYNQITVRIGNYSLFLFCGISNSLRMFSGVIVWFTCRKYPRASIRAVPLEMVRVPIQLNTRIMKKVLEGWDGVIGECLTMSAPIPERLKQFNKRTNKRIEE